MPVPSLFVQQLTHVLAALTIVLGVMTVLWLILLIAGKRTEHLKLHARYAVQMGFFASLIGIMLTILYSEVFHYAVCDLCWFQRIFLYPQAFLFGLAWYRNEKNILPYSLLLSIFGGVIALYHHILQMGYNIYKPCSTAPFAVDCSVPSFVEFHFVTFPFMSLVLFAFLALVAGNALYLAKRS